MVPDYLKHYVNGQSHTLKHDELQGAALWDFSEPPPPQPWVIDGLVPEGHITLLVADGGLGKSYLAAYAMTCVALGKAFLGKPVRRGAVLYVDFELSLNDQRRRMWQIFRGMSLEPPFSELEGYAFYLRMPPGSSLLKPKCVQHILSVADRTAASLIVIDSLSIASKGGDVSESTAIIDVMDEVRKVGTVLALDHVAKGQDGKPRSVTPFGSVFKRNMARSLLTITGYEAEKRLTVGKSNFGPPHPPIDYNMRWGQDSLRFTMHHQESLRDYQSSRAPF